ncbi:RNA polymerase II-associated protein 1-like, partial [Lingula anatina]|uniref:RNA polymerase II-associated protein 1-like n=1 Tax=Lingula anatina TaxID=7574 RepID=A0A2R2MN74_LINAN
MDRAHYVSRPKPGDDEDDLLEFQRTFLSSKASSSATVVTSSKPDKRADEAINGNETAAIKTTPAERDVVKLQGLPSTLPTVPTDIPQTPKRSKFRQKNDAGKSSTEYMEDPEESLEKHDRHITKVLSEIKERDVHHVPVYFPRQVSDAFPKVLQWDPKSK